MDLIPASSSDAASEDDPKRITLSERSKTLARIRTTEVERIGQSQVDRQLLGRIQYDETRLHTVTAWTGGRIDRLHVEVTGQQVRRGQVIATLYSPEIYAAHQDLLSAKRHMGRMKGAGASGRSAAGTALGAARQKLRLLGVPSDTIERMKAADEPWRHIPIRSPFRGTITERIASEGSYVDTGSPLYEVADLRQVWVQLDAYESDLPLLEEGQKVDIEARALPGKVLEGEIAFIDPFIDPETRTAQVRVEVDNPGRKLRPGMFAEAVVGGDTRQLGEQPLVIPESAPLFTGRRSVVYVEVPKAERPTYEMRVVKLGPKSGDRYPVLAGLQEGEEVVTHGAFVLDSDLQIRGGISMMSVPDDTEQGPYDEIVSASPQLEKELGDVVSSYLEMQSHMAADELEEARGAAEALIDEIEKVGRPETARGRDTWSKIAKKLVAATMDVRDADALDDARPAFEHVSTQIERLLETFGNPLDRPLYVAHCPMAFGDRGANWIQSKDEVDNAYLGKSMRNCGELRATVAPGTYLGADGATEGASSGAGGHTH